MPEETEDGLLEPPSGETPKARPPLRESMTLLENFLTVLMPLSVAISIFLVATSSAPALYNRVAAVAFFYCSWAVYNWLTTKPQEKGHYPLFTCMIGCFVGNSSRKDIAIVCKCIAILGAATTWLFFAGVGYRGALTFPASKLAHVNKKTLYWAWVLKAYFVGSLFSWALIVYRLTLHT